MLCGYTFCRGLFCGCGLRCGLLCGRTFRRGLFCGHTLCRALFCGCAFRRRRFCSRTFRRSLFCGCARQRLLLGLPRRRPANFRVAFCCYSLRHLTRRRVTFRGLTFSRRQRRRISGRHLVVRVRRFVYRRSLRARLNNLLRAH